jgi:CRP/FNR family cyclic AMP-dependent transcriptional regulator
MQLAGKDRCCHNLFRDCKILYLIDRRYTLLRLFKWACDSEKDHDLKILKEVPLFRGLKKHFLRKLLTDLFEKEYKEGEIIFSEGDTGKALYIVMAGSVNIIKQANPGEQFLARLGPGSYFGELALIRESPRFASAIVEEKTRLLIMYKSYFDSLMKGSGAISSQILVNLVESLSNYISNNRNIDDGGNR